ncbi:MAG: GMC family oxidoreductase [Aggregatilineales bacterium]
MPVEKKVDVVTVGAGWTAGIMAWKLTQAGMKVVSLEQGPFRAANPNFQHDHDALRYHVRHALMVDLGKETWTWRPNPKAPTLPMRQYGSFNPGLGVGGAGIHWAGQNWRFEPTDFQYRTHHVQRYGEKKLPAGSQIQDWGISYDELEPYYDAFEYDIGVSGRAGNLNGTIIDGGNPFEGPRNRPYPLPPLAVNIQCEMFAQTAKGMGYHPFPQPAAITSQAYTSPLGTYRGGCIYCGFCTRYGCEVDAKASPVNSHIPAALKTGRYEIRANSKVTQINIGPDGKATGVMYRDQLGIEHEQPADLVLLTAFTLTNVRLLLMSRSKQHANGVGNDQGRVGKNYTYQLSQNPVNGVFEGRRFNMYMGNSATINVIYDFYGDNFDHSALDFIGGGRMYAAGGERDPQTSVGGFPIGGSANTPNWGKGWKEELRKNWDSLATIGFEGDILPYDDQYLDLDPVYTDSFGLPLLRLTFDFHQDEINRYRFLTARAKAIMQKMGPTRLDSTDELAPYNIHDYQSTHCTGGAIMGVSPSNSVTNRYGQVWDTPNVFVAGAALFPQNPGANPTGTVCALAYMAGDAIRDHYLKDPGRIIS